MSITVANMQEFIADKDPSEPVMVERDGVLIDIKELGVRVDPSRGSESDLVTYVVRLWGAVGGWSLFWKEKPC